MTDINNQENNELNHTEQTDPQMTPAQEPQLPPQGLSAPEVLHVEGQQPLPALRPEEEAEAPARKRRDAGGGALRQGGLSQGQDGHGAFRDLPGLLPLQRQEGCGSQAHIAVVRHCQRHGGAPDVKPGTPLDPAYTQENLPLLEAGCRTNLLAHIDIIRKSGIRPVVCLNHFYTDTDAEVALVKQIVEEAGCRFALSKHWEKGGEGAEELARQVIAACEEPNDFHFLCDVAEPLSARLEKQVKEVYGGEGVDYEPAALEKNEERIRVTKMKELTTGPG